MIHSDLGEKGRFGRTDRGAEGIEDFLRTHKCNALCRQLGLPHKDKYDPNALVSADAESSRNTSQITLNPTNHMQDRKKERDISTRELKAAKKHGKRTVQPDGHVLYDHQGVRAVLDGSEKVGICLLYTSPSPRDS